jgi:hypothetical protein
VTTYVVCLAVGQLWPRLPFVPHRVFWTDPAHPQRRERLAKLAHLFLGRVHTTTTIITFHLLTWRCVVGQINLWIVAMLGFGIVAVAQLFVARPYEWLIWVDVCFGMCVVLYGVCLYLDLRAFSLALQPDRARVLERKAAGKMTADNDYDDEYGVGVEEEEERGERKALLPIAGGNVAATPLKTYAATDNLVITTTSSSDLTPSTTSASPTPTSPTADGNEVERRRDDGGND